MAIAATDAWSVSVSCLVLLRASTAVCCQVLACVKASGTRLRHGV